MKKTPLACLIWFLTLAPVFAAGDLPTADARFATAPMEQVELGQLLFYDPILSGNRGVACATCHDPEFGTSDGVSLSLGDGGVGRGVARAPDPDNLPEQRVPRNSPALFNLGADEFRSLFHDGRLEADSTEPTGFRTPLGSEMVAGFDSVLAAQAMFPVLSGDEMAGHYSENEISRAVRQGRLTDPQDGAWALIAARVGQLPGYRRRFDAVIGTERDIRFTDIANAIAAFVAFEWRADQSPFDKFLRGEADLAPDEKEGMALFYGRAGCSACHSGQFQTDQSFRAIAMPQIGPGKAAPFENHSRDTGRAEVTGAPEDMYRFRTPSLRNVTQTAPYSHAGAYATLRSVVVHHLDPVAALSAYDRRQAVLPDLPGAQDWRILDDPAEIAAIAAANELEPVNLNASEVDALLAFLGALTDEASLKGRLGVPESVPSGLTVGGR